MCHHIWFRFGKNAHRDCVSEQASDEPLVEVCFLGNLVKGDLAARGDHLQNLEANNRVDADDICDLDDISFWASSWKLMDRYPGKLVDQHQRFQENLMELSSCVQHIVTKVVDIGREGWRAILGKGWRFDSLS